MSNVEGIRNIDVLHHLPGSISSAKTIVLPQEVRKLFYEVAMGC